jgi:hypothetical protein
MNQPGEQPEHGGSEFSSARLTEELEQSQERQRPATEFRFAFCRHFEPDNATLAATWLKDCDVVAMESVGGSPEARAEMERDYNEFVHRGAAGENVDELLSLIEHASPFRRQLLSKLATYGPKRIVLIDAGDADTEIMGAIQKWEDAKAEYLAATPKYLSLQELQASTRKYMQAGADRDGPREALQARQLQQLARPETGEPPHKVGVAIGLAHTPTQQMLDQLGYTTSQRQIDVLSPGLLEQDIPQSFSDRARVFLSSHPGEPLPTEVVNRVILDRYYGTSDVITDDLRSPDRHVSSWDLDSQMDYRIIKLVEAMDDARVASLLEKIDHLYHTDEWKEEPWLTVDDAVDDALEKNYNLYRDRLPRIRGGYT